MQLSQKEKTFSEFCAPFFKSRINFEHIQKKRWDSELICFRNCGLSKTWLGKYKKSTASEHNWTSNMVNGPKHC